MWFSKRFAVSVALGITFVQTGCSSIKSTFLQRDATNTGWTSMKSCGVPVTLKVTTHLRVTVTENRLFTQSVDGKEWTALVDAQGCAVTERSWDLVEVKTDKIFTVDFKRPAAGIIKYDAKFKDQYFTEFSNEVEDRTISDIAAAIQGIIRVLPNRTGTGLGVAGGAGNQPEIRRFPTVVAVAVFAVDDPAWEVQMTDFLAQHLGGHETLTLEHGQTPLPGMMPQLQELSRTVAPESGITPLAEGTPTVPPAPRALLSKPRASASAQIPRLSPQSIR
jgi:hypothetical protein